MSQGHWMAHAAATRLRKAQAHPTTETMNLNIYKEVASTAAGNCNCGAPDARDNQPAEPGSAAMCGRI